MSRYFSRLAARSGLMPPPSARTSPTSTNDLVEHSADVDAGVSTPTSTITSSVPSPSTPNSVDTPLPIAPSSSLHRDAMTAAPTSAREPPSQQPAPLSRVSAPMRRTAPFSSPRRASDVASTDATRDAVTTLRPPGIADTIESPRAPSRANAPAADAPMLRAPTIPAHSIHESSADSSVATTPMKKAPRAQTPSVATLETPAGDTGGVPFPAPDPIHAPTPRTATPVADTSAPPAARDINIRIGAVRLEIHAPTPAPVAPAPATPEPPRFTPRRHYLRG